MYKKNILCAIIIAATVSQARGEAELFAKPSTSPKTAILTAGAGTLTGLATYYGVSALFELCEADHINITAELHTLLTFEWANILNGVCKTFKTPANYVIGAATLSLGALAAWLTYRYQPEGKFGRAHSTLMNALNNETLNALIEAEQELIRNIDDSYMYHTYPRVAAYNEFLNYHKNMIDAVTLLKEAIVSAEDAELTQLAQKCIDKLEHYINDIKECISIIRNSDNWVEQLKGHDAMLARQAQERAAIASQQIAWNTAFINRY